MRTSHIPISTLLVIQIICSVLLLPSVTLAQSAPHVIYGEVTDTSSDPVQNAYIYVNNTNTNESLSTITSVDGEYSVDISAYPSGYSIGHILLVTAVYFHYRTNATIVVDGEPAQNLDLPLNITHHFINGRVSLPDDSPARQYSISVTNNATGDTDYPITNNTGHYRVDLAMYQNGYEEGDYLVVSCDLQGFFRINVSAVSNTTEQTIDLHLDDVEAPSISIWKAPDNISVETEFDIVARVIENFKVENVSIYIKVVGESMFSLLKMHQDDGDTYDWDSDGTQDPRLYGRSIPPQSKIGIVYYYISATDGINIGTLPESDPETYPLEVEVIDDTFPVITHTSLTLIEAGEPEDLVTTVDDNIEVDNVTLWLQGVGEAIFSPFDMRPNGNEDEYNATIPAQTPGVILYYITANDTSNNTARNPPTGDISVTVTDTTPPSIIHAPINSAHVFNPLNFTAEIDDLLGVNAVWVNVTDSSNNQDNDTMSNWAGNTWSYENQTGQSISGILYYTIWANDTSNNLATSPSSGAYPVLITDNNTPIITHVPVETSEVFEEINITANVTDDVAVTEVTLAYKNVGDAFYTSVLMNPAGGNWTANIPAQDTLGFVEYYINATDGSNNITHPALKPCHDISIVDTLSPILTPGPATLDIPLIGVPRTLWVNVSDNYMVDYVILYFRAVNNKTWASIQMTPDTVDSRGNGTYSGDIPAQQIPGNVTYYFWANDTSDNNATLPDVLPKLNPLIINFVDGQRPEIYFTPPGEIQVNTTLPVFVNVTDDLEVTTVNLFYNGTLDSGFSEIPLSKSGNTSYVGDVPAQFHSGPLQLFFTASDGANVNQTQTYNIPVLNAVPTIIHINKTFASVKRAVDILATVEDDVHVERVELSWRVKGEVAYNNVDMNSSLYTVYFAELPPFDQVLALEYHITAYDIEDSTVWPDAGQDATLHIADVTPPTIIHQPLENLTVNDLPIITADVYDDMDMLFVRVWFENTTTQDFVNVALSPVSGNDTQFATVLGRQPEGEFSYFIEVSDGTNIVRLPADTEFTVNVSGIPGSPWNLVILAVVIVLMVIAVLLIYQYRRKTIKT